MNKIGLFLLDIFFPNRCPVCGKIISFDGYVCDECLKKLKELDAESSKLYSECKNKRCILKDDTAYSKTVSVYIYSGAARDGIISLKDGSLNFGYHLGQMLGKKILSDEKLKKADALTAVPMAKKKRRIRGYNQAEVIAKTASKVTGITYVRDILFKNDSPAQHLLSAEQRRKNTGSYYAGSTDLKGKNIIIFDDVITTGSTVGRCARLLKEMNAGEVYSASGTITLL